MIKKEEIKKLADLSRIEISDEEIEKIQKDLDSVLEYVSLVSSLGGVCRKEGNSATENVNIVREDENPHESSIYSDKILENANKKEKGYIKVKKIIDTDK